MKRVFEIHHVIAVLVWILCPSITDLALLLCRQNFVQLCSLPLTLQFLVSIADPIFILYQKLQEELDHISAWYSTFRAMAKPAKAAVSWFSLYNHLANRPSCLWVSFCGDVVERNNSMKYLEVMFKDHVEQITAKARKGLATVEIIAAANLGQPLLVLLH